jgi:hypothetical protein
MLMPNALVWMQAAATAAPPDSTDSLIAGIGTGGELTLALLLALAAAGGVVAMVAGDRARQRDAERRRALLSPDARGE